MEQLEGWEIRRLVVGRESASTGGEGRFCEGIVDTKSGMDKDNLGDGNMMLLSCPLSG